MDERLRQALIDGHEQRAQMLKESSERNRTKEQQKREAHQRAIEYWRKRIREEPAILFQRIRDAVAQGKTSVDFVDAPDGLDEALREVEGLHPMRKVSWGKRYDEGPEEECFIITVTWEKPPP
jgi:hypothetical protein